MASALREVYGYSPIYQQGSYDIENARVFIQGREKETPNVFSTTITFRIIRQENLPTVDGSGGGKYNKFISVIRTCDITIKEGTWDIVSHTPIRGYEAVSLVGGTINNLITSDTDTNEIDEIVKDLLDDFKKLPEDTTDMLDPNTLAANLMNGKVQTIPDVKVPGSQLNMLEWKGTLPFDVMMNAVHRNLEILSNNFQLKGDMLTQTYAALFDKSLAYAVDLEKSRMNLYLGILQYKAALLKALADFKNNSIGKSLQKIQAKLTAVQMNGFRTNNANKLFGVQLEAASTGFSSGMLDTSPVTNSNAELMEFYTDVKTQSILM